MRLLATRVAGRNRLKRENAVYDKVQYESLKENMERNHGPEISPNFECAN